MELFRFSILCFCAFSLSFILCFMAKGRLLLDTPNERSAHSLPTSRFGGIAIMFSFISVNILDSLLLTYPLQSIVLRSRLLILISILGILGALDDRKHLSAPLRLFGQTLFCLGSLYLWQSPSAFPLTSFPYINYAIGIFLMLSFINASNFSDGLNGLWSGTFLLWSFYVGYFFGFTSFFLLMIAAVLGFFVLNFPKGKIFLGDSGSTFLGGFALLYGLHLAHSNSFEGTNFLVNLIIVFAPFIFVFSDIVMTLLIRLSKGYSPLTPHKDHFKQQLVHKVGLSHTTVTLLYFFGSVLSSFTVGFSAMKGLPLFGMLFYTALQLLFFYFIQRWASLSQKRIF